MRYLIAEGDSLFDRVADSGDEFNPSCISELVNEPLQELTNIQFYSDQESINADDLSAADYPMEGKQ